MDFVKIKAKMKVVKFYYIPLAIAIVIKPFSIKQEKRKEGGGRREGERKRAQRMSI